MIKSYRISPQHMRTNYKWIFWDNDGVLVDTEKLFFQANQEILSSLDNIQQVVDEVLG